MNRQDQMNRQDPVRAFPADLFAGRRFCVVGLGKNGLPAARALAAMGASVQAWDDDPAAREAVVHDVAADNVTADRATGRSATADGAIADDATGDDAAGDRTMAHAAAPDIELRDPSVGDFAFDALVLSPGIPHRLPQPHVAAVRARAAGVPILSDVELLFQAVRRSGSRARFAGITGTNGKSTTTALLAHILGDAGWSMAAGANLGPAALSLPRLGDDGVYVLELSSYMLERLEFGTLRCRGHAEPQRGPHRPARRHGGLLPREARDFRPADRCRPCGGRHRRCRIPRDGRVAVHAPGSPADHFG